ncbi:MAG: site-specific integrase [Nitrososphaerales archaeon]
MSFEAHLSIKSPHWRVFFASHPSELPNYNVLHSSIKIEEQVKKGVVIETPHFETWLTVDKRLSKRSVRDYVLVIKGFLKVTGAKKSDDLDSSVVRGYLNAHIQESPSTYSNRLKAFGHFFTFLGSPKVMESFAFPSIPYSRFNILQ